MEENNIVDPYQRILQPQFLMTPIGQMIARALYSNFQCVYNVGETLYTGEFITTDITIIYDSNDLANNGAKFLQYSPITYRDRLSFGPNSAEAVNNKVVYPPINLGSGVAFPFTLTDDIYFVMRWRSEMYNDNRLIRTFFQDIEFKTKKILDKEFQDYLDAAESGKDV